MKCKPAKSGAPNEAVITGQVEIVGVGHRDGSSVCVGVTSNSCTCRRGEIHTKLPRVGPLE